MAYKSKFMNDCDSKISNPINMIPLIDIMLVLLVIFMIAMPVISSSMNVNSVGGEESTEKISVTVIIKSSGEVFIDNNKIDINNSIDLPIEKDSSVILSVEDDVSFDKLSRVMHKLSNQGISSIVFAREKSKL